MTRITNKTSRPMTTPITEAIETGSEKKERLKWANILSKPIDFYAFFIFGVQYHKECILHVLGNFQTQTQFITVKNCSQQWSGYVW